MEWTRKHLLGLRDMPKEEIVMILDQARSFHEVGTRKVKKVPALQGRTVVNLFYEPSTRTANSFALAAKRLSADTLTFSSGGSSTSSSASFSIAEFRCRWGCASTTRVRAVPSDSGREV